MVIEGCRITYNKCCLSEISLSNSSTVTNEAIESSGLGSDRPVEWVWQRQSGWTGVMCVVLCDECVRV